MKNKLLKLLFLGMFTLFAFQSFGQLQVSGMVTDSSGELLPGVTIQIKGTDEGTITDLNGRYTLSLADDQAVLVFSFIGMETQEVNVNGRSSIDIVMNSTSLEVDEVVVTALGISRKKKVAGIFGLRSGG